MQLQVENVVVEVQRKDIKNMYLRVDPTSGRVRISAPRQMKEETILAFVRQKLAWIRAHQKKNEAPSVVPQSYADKGDTVSLFGTPYVLRVMEGAGRARLHLMGREVILYLPKGATEEEKQRAIKAWQRAELQKKLDVLVPKWEAITALKSDSVHIRDMRTRWGTCNVNRKRVWFSLALAQKPTECLEYVILHELAHLRVPNHGKAFVAILDAYMPDWRTRKKRLNAES